jgi:hypothetical protein
MAFRTQAKTGARVIAMLALALPMWAQTSTYEVRQGTLRIDAGFIEFKERGKHPKRSRRWSYDDIQELVLASNTLRIVSYENPRWGVGGVWEFDRLPAAVAKDCYPMFSKKLDRRFVAALADETVKAEWQIPVKLVHGRGGSQGVLTVGADSVVYKTAQPGESRTWHTAYLENVASSDPFDLTITTHERDCRFQLKQALPGARFDELWRRVNQANGLQILKGELQ